MSSGVSKSGISSSITVIITIILALVVLGVGLGMVSKAKPVHSVDDLIKQTWNLFNESEENGNVDIDTLCPSGEHSDKMTFVVRKGILNENLAQNRIITDWRCDVPGGSGTCLITKLERYEKVKDDIIEGGFNPANRGFFEFKTNKTPDDSEYYSDDNGDCIGGNGAGGQWTKYYYSEEPGIKYKNSDKITLEGYFQSTKECIRCEHKVGECKKLGLDSFERAGYDHSNYEFNFTYYYCCPKYFKWNDTLNACCPTDEDDCTPYAEINNFTEYCANSEKISGKSLIEKEDCGISASESGCTNSNPWCCVKDNDIQTSCDSDPTDWGSESQQNGYKGNNKPLCLDHSDEGNCYRGDDHVDQCARLNFEDYYGRSVYVKGIRFRVKSDGECHNDLSVYICEKGKTCTNNQNHNNWERIEEKINAYDVLYYSFIDKNVSAIDICTVNEDCDERIAWVKFTTNESLEATPLSCEDVCGVANYDCRGSQPGSGIVESNCVWYEANSDGTCPSGLNCYCKHEDPIDTATEDCTDSGVVNKGCNDACQNLGYHDGTCKDNIPDPYVVNILFVDYCIYYEPHNNLGTGYCSGGKTCYCSNYTGCVGECTNEGCVYKNTCLMSMTTKEDWGWTDSPCQRDEQSETDCIDDSGNYNSWDDSEILCLEGERGHNLDYDNHLVGQCAKIDLAGGFYGSSGVYNVTVKGDGPGVAAPNFILIAHNKDGTYQKIVKTMQSSSINTFDLNPDKTVNYIELCVVKGGMDSTSYDYKIDWIKGTLLKK